MTLKPVIPVLADARVGGYLVGSAFLGNVNDRPFLITAAHGPVGDQPTNDWSLYSERLQLLTSRGVVLQLALFNTDALGNRVPLFGYVPRTDGPGLADLMWYPLEGLGRAFGELTLEYEVHEVPSSFNTGVTWTAYGYPVADSGWPPPPQVATGAALGWRDGGMMLEAMLATERGFSGGPVFDERGLLVGMVPGKNESVAQIVPSNVIHALVRDWKPPHKISEYTEPATPSTA